jgi:8-oxo-dGTP diphosphatase
VHRPRYDDWSLPKGKLNTEESFLDAAMREVEEETGHEVEVGPTLGTVGYVTPNGTDKVVRWWLMEAGEGEFRPNAEVDEIAWHPAGEAAKALSYGNDRAVLRRAGDLVKNPSSGRVFLIRHALAGDKKRRNGDDRDRHIDRRGHLQAAALRIGLSLNPLTRVLCSDYTRCIETVEPVATALGLSAEPEGRLRVGTPSEDVRDLLRELRGESAAVCTHGEVIGPLLGGLDAEGVDLEGPLEWRKGSVWVLETRKGRIRSGRYIPPPR